MIPFFGSRLSTELFDNKLSSAQVSELLVLLDRKKQEAEANVDPARRRLPLYKRLMDLAVAVPALIIVSPVMLVVALLLKLESNAPVFYKSKRVGGYYKVFELIKFRSMVPGADKKVKDLSHLNLYAKKAEEEAAQQLCGRCRSNGSACDGVRLIDETGTEICERLYLERKETQAVFSKFKDDPRITPLGKFLRNTSIDELPQLLNIIKGDMSLVGNRPLPLYEAEKLTTDQSFKRFMAPAGLTGLWQVTKRGRGDMTDEERIGLDNEYAANFNFWLDMKIIFRTFGALLQKENS